MQFHGRRLELACANLRHDQQRFVDGVLDQHLVFAARTVQHEIGHLLLQTQRARMADADAQPPVILCAERGGDVLQAIVPTGRAALFEARDAGHQIELVVHHQHLVGRDLVEARQPADRLAGTVHIGLRLQQPDLVAADGRLGDQRVETRLALQARVGQAVGQVVDQPEAGVVAGLFVFGAGIAEADDQTYGHMRFQIEKNPRLQKARARVLQFRNRITTAADYFLALAAGLASAAGAAGAAAASADTWPAGTEAVAMVRFEPWVTAVTPAGSTSSPMCSEWPTSMFDRSTVMNSGRSFGRHDTSISLATWLMVAPCSLTAGETSALAKCRATFMWILVLASTRWKSACRTSCLNAWTWKSRSSTCWVTPSISRSRIDEWKTSFFSAWYRALWSSEIFTGASAPP